MSLKIGKIGILIEYLDTFGVSKIECLRENQNFSTQKTLYRQVAKINTLMELVKLIVMVKYKLEYRDKSMIIAYRIMKLRRFRYIEQD